jgi:hypothetical protein
VEIEMPPDFPLAKYRSVENQLSRHLAARQMDAAAVPGFFEYAGGWNALVFRFRAAHEYGSSAALSLAREQGSLQNENGMCRSATSLDSLPTLWPQSTLAASPSTTSAD